MRALPIVPIVGKSESGKTMLMEQLIAEFKKRGYKVAAIKHCHGGMEIDHPGKDTWKFAQAGSDAVCISSPDKLALIKNVDHDPGIQEVTPVIGPEFDLVLVEGFKKSKLPKIEVHRKRLGNDLLCCPEELSAIVTDGSLDTLTADYHKLPVFRWGDTAAIADFIEKSFLPNKQGNVSQVQDSPRKVRGARGVVKHVHRRNIDH
jgi:molybdopterin-guanine dinucleotide biosynthesis protein B